MSAPDREWTHLSDAQARGAACVMCARPTSDKGWTGVPVGRAEDGTEVVACAPDSTRMVNGPRGQLMPSGPTSSCAAQAAQTVPDHFE